MLPYFRIPMASALEIITQVEQAVAGRQEEGRSLGITKADLDSFADAFEHVERAAARKVMV